MEAAAGTVGPGLGHEGGLAAVARGDPLDRALVAYGVIGGGHGVGLVVQGQFQLGRGEFGDGTLQRQAQDIGCGPELTQEGCMILDLRKAIDLDALGPSAGADRARRQDLAVRPPGHVDQVEFQLTGSDGGQAIGRIAVEDPAQHVPRIEVIGGSVQLVHGQKDLGDIGAQPGRRGQGSGDGTGPAVGVAVLPDQSSVLAVSAKGVDHQDGARQEAAIVIDRRQLLDPQALAPRDAGHACEGDLDKPDFGVSGQEGPAFLGISDRIGGHGRNLGSDVTSTFATPGGTRQPGRALTLASGARSRSSWRPVPWAPGRW